MKKRTLKTEYLYIILLAVLMIGLIFLIVNKVSKHFWQDNTVDSKNSEIVIDWKERYPFQENTKKEEKAESVATTNGVDSLLTKYQNSIFAISNFIENRTDSLPFNEQILIIGAKTRKLIYRGALYSNNNLQQLENGQIIEIEQKSETMETFAERVNAFKKALDVKGIPLLYVQTPKKYDETETFSSSVNENRDMLINCLSQKGIDTFDLRKSAKKDHLSIDSMFYKTDHHWKTSMGLWASQNIVKKLESNYDLKFDQEQLNTDKYNLVEFKNAMFGSYGQTAGRGWCEPETHPVYYPKFKTSFDIDIPNKGIKQSGDFNVLFNNKKLNEFKTGEAGYVYETACYGNTPLTKIKNNDLPNAPKLLIIRDSFSLATLPYLSCVCSQVHSIDIRKNNGNFDGSVLTYIDDFKPDAVVFILSNPIYEDIH